MDPAAGLKSGTAKVNLKARKPRNFCSFSFFISWQRVGFGTWHIDWHEAHKLLPICVHSPSKGQLNQSFAYDQGESYHLPGWYAPLDLGGRAASPLCNKGFIPRVGEDGPLVGPHPAEGKTMLQSVYKMKTNYGIFGIHRADGPGTKLHSISPHLQNLNRVTPNWRKACKPYPVQCDPITVTDEGIDLFHRCLFCRWNTLGSACCFLSVHPLPASNLEFGWGRSTFNLFLSSSSFSMVLGSQRTRLPLHGAVLSYGPLRLKKDHSAQGRCGLMSHGPRRTDQGRGLCELRFVVLIDDY